MKRITVYNPAELKRKHPEAFESAYGRWKDSDTDIPWDDEIIDSLKAVFKASGIALTNWEIGAWCYSYVRFDMESDVRDLAGNRALAWLENNLFYHLRENRPFAKRVKKYEKWHDFTKYGEIPSCPFTGVCFDEDFIESLLKDIKAGDTLGEAYSNLASVASKLFEQEIEQANSEEEFLLQDHLEFTKDGHQI